MLFLANIAAPKVLIFPEYGLQLKDHNKVLLTTPVHPTMTIPYNHTLTIYNLLPLTTIQLWLLKWGCVARLAGVENASLLSGKCKYYI